MFRRKSDYALNKMNPDAIVYLDAEGKSRRLTREDFDSEEEFLRWKKWSDEDYHATEKKQHIEDNHTVPMNPAVETFAPKHNPEPADLPDEETLLRQCRNLFTEKMFRRYWLYQIDNLTEDEIAKREGISQQNISKSIRAAKKIFLHFLKTRV